MGYVGKHHASMPSGGRRILAAEAPSPTGGGRRRVLALVFALLSGSVIVVGFQGDLSRGHAPSTSPGGLSTSTLTLLPLNTSARKSVDAVSSRVWPVQLSIPAIKVSADVTGLGLNVDRSIEVPRNPAEVGWYRLGPSPGRPGSSVILGHVDSTHGPAVFYRLRNLKPGNTIAVRLSDAAVAHFEVSRVVSYANRDFPAKKVYEGRPGDRPTLNLVTCGGKYDKEAGGYQSNVVVYTTYLWATDDSRHPEVIAGRRSSE